MKKQLLIVACGLLAGAGAMAQQRPEMKLREPFELPKELRQELAQRGVAQPTAAARSTTVRKPGKTTIYQWSPLTQWSATPMVELNTYDASGQVTQVVERDSVTQRPSTRYSWAYNAAGQQTRNLIENWNGTAWQNQTLSLDSYNSASSLTEHLEQKWVNGAWQNVFRATVQYDARNHYVAWSNEDWRNNAWVATYGGRATVTYNAAGAVVEETEDLLNTATGTYQPNLRHVYSYASATALLPNGQTSQHWENGAYVNQQRVNNAVRDSQGRVLTSESELWLNGAWQLNSRFTTTYLDNGSTLGSFERRQSNAWVPLYRYAHIYDQWGTEVENVSETFTNNAWTIQEAYRYLLRYNAAHDLLARVRQNYDTNTKTYVNGVKFTYSDFQSITLGTRPSAELAAATQLYPNPTTGRLTVALPAQVGQGAAAVEVVNSLGQVVQRQVLLPRQGQAALDLSALSAGVYTVRIGTAAGLVVKKVVRQ
ncbi:T9SS type A sorting domain-containing protein [Hymenobacter aquaticus]|uniref:T9SS type A sorting domain-containing protein n=1 Tax=Hymenobacter aquaticus TaxID=1867101 RepID=A0A4Z0Q7Q5_9BACT|nr:T9SS type A sorting domain-containing protein [Hymenobacter aquaticus]TGE25439.1 T9SS type A sorting domain-containing protein [Hymenobacter aquaticus]